MKKYKHKTGEIAIEIPENGPLAKYKINHGYISASFVENTLDWTEVIEKEYEILSIKYERNDLIYIKEFNSNFFKKDCGKIHLDQVLLGAIGIKGNGYDIYIYSVKRISDGEVFTIGDKVVFNKIHEFTIEKFYMDYNNNHLLCSNDAGTGHVNITKVSKVKTPLLITEDGEEIYNKDCLLWDTSIMNWDYLEETKAEYFPTWKEFPKKRKAWFSKEKAEEYLLMNKPCLSLNDVASIYPGINKTHNTPSHQAERLKELVKTKI